MDDTNPEWHERQEEVPFLWAGQPVKRHFVVSNALPTAPFPPTPHTPLCHRCRGQSSNQAGAAPHRQRDKMPALPWQSGTHRDMNDLHLTGVIAAEQEPPTSFHLVY